ncbi:hypothetical protein EJ110_NYTH07732 [Nymphaea thermarum]|nr:hypothetical protein EJ110_NYTH07732 [Nymphaea thermarum]
MEGYPHGEMSCIYHSSHLHALQLISSSHGHPKSRCCDEPTVTSLINAKGRSNPVYGCRPCNFYIHKACAELVPYIRHPSHRQHTLTLVPTSPYLLNGGGTTCDACWKPAGGFAYHCTHCSFDLHTHCAFLPPTIEQPTSHPHLLSLSFSSGISSYDCDLCRRKIAATAWFYYCQPCDFQAHTDCIDQARRRCPPPGAAEPWPVDGQPTAPAAGRPLNPLSGLTPANWHGQAMGAPGLSGGLEPNRGNSFEELKIAYNSLNDKHGEGVGNSGHADVVEELKNTAADINAVQLAAAQCNLQINTVSSMCNLLYNVRI